MPASSPHQTRGKNAARTDRGAGFVEYGLLLALMAFALLTLVDALGKDTSSSIDDSASSVASFG